MPKMTVDYIVKHADELADRFEAWEPDAAELRPVEPYRALQDAASRRVDAEADIVDAVTACRAAGWSWAEIGRSLGVSAQAAHQRYRTVRA